MYTFFNFFEFVIFSILLSNTCFVGADGELSPEESGNGSGEEGGRSLGHQCPVMEDYSINVDS